MPTENHIAYHLARVLRAADSLVEFGEKSPLAESLAMVRDYTECELDDLENSVGELPRWVLDAWGIPRGTK
jgi:hypothetical protein